MFNKLVDSYKKWLYFYVGGLNDMTLKKTKTNVKINRSDWEKLKKNPALSEAIELLEDISDLETAKKIRGKAITVEQYLKKRGL